MKESLDHPPRAWEHPIDEVPPAIFLEHYVEERTPQGRLGRKATWDRLSFHSWAPRRVWLSGRERIAFGDPHWEHLPAHEVEALLGREEMRALLWVKTHPKSKTDRSEIGSTIPPAS